jgi:anti-anti-sigma regulatory factor
VLKITITETATERRWIVQGRLVGPWVSELRTTWKRAHRARDDRACIIDLNDVTLIDKSGERLLRAMCKKGAQLIANGMYVKQVLEQLRDAIGGTNATSPSADRTARTEDQ